MAINFQRGLLSIDDHGDILLYPKDGGMELKLGDISHDDEFKPSGLLSNSTEWIDELKTKLLGAYLGEEELYHDHPQIHWSDGLKSFMGLDQIKPIERDQWVKLDEFIESPMGDQRRYQDSEGLALHGVYRDLISDQLVLMDQGQLKKQWAWTKDMESLDVSTAQRIVHHYARGWKDQDGQELDFSEAMIKDLEAGLRHSATVYVGRKTHMQDLAESMEAKGFEVLVRSHQSDEQKFQVNVFAKMSLGESIEAVKPHLSKENLEELKLHMEKSLLEWYRDGLQEVTDSALVELIQATLSGVPVVLEQWRRSMEAQG